MLLKWSVSGVCTRMTIFMCIRYGEVGFSTSYALYDE